MDIPGNLDVWVMAGQSNMEGVGRLDNALEPDDRVFNFTSAGNWEVAAEPLHRFWESFTPVHQNLMRQWLTDDQKDLSDEELARIADETRTTGTGVGMSFGKSMADALGKPIGLIAAAHGGTSLEQWSPALKDQGGLSLYGAMLERIKRAGGNVKGILWYQGESDATPETAATYAQRFDEWIASVRDDLGQPELPVIVVQIGRFAVREVEDPGTWPDARSWEVVRDALRTLPERMPYTAVTTAIDLGLEDCIHVATDGLIRLGKRMAKLALHLSGHSEILTGPKVERIEIAEPDRSMGVLRVICSGLQGGWKIAQHMAGFELRSADNTLHPTNMVMDARADSENPSTIRVLLAVLPENGDMLAYGPGLNPYCNVVDEADMALCAFTSIGLSPLG